MADGQDKGSIFGGLTQMVVPSPGAPETTPPPAPTFDHLGAIQVAPPTAKSKIPNSPTIGQKAQQVAENIIPLAHEARVLQEQVVNPSKSGQQANELVHNTLAHPENLAMGGIESEEAGAIKGALEGAVERYIPTQAEPNYAYRSRDVGEQGIPANEDSHAQLTSSENQAHLYAQDGQRNAETGKPQEVVRVDMNKIRPSDYITKKQDGDISWHKLNRDIPEELVEKMPTRPTISTGIQGVKPTPEAGK